MVQERKKRIFAAFTDGHKTTNDLMRQFGLSKGQVNLCLRELVAEELIDVKGLNPLPRGFGNKRIFGLAVKKKAINAFDWRNWVRRQDAPKTDISKTGQMNKTVQSGLTRGLIGGGSNVKLLGI